MNYLLKSQMFEPTTPPETAALRGEEGELAASWCIAGGLGRAMGELRGDGASLGASWQLAGTSRC